jgi:DNA transformation protein
MARIVGHRPAFGTPAGPTLRAILAADPFVAFCLELLSSLAPASARRMFGGHGVYVDQLFIGLVANGALFLKADAAAQPAFVAAGCQPFSYRAAGTQRAVAAWWSAPEDALESPAQMLPWARLAMASALRAANARPPAARRKPAAASRQARPTAGRGDATGRRGPGQAKSPPKPSTKT